MANLDIKIREAELEDLEVILDFITQISELDKCENLLIATADKLQKTLFYHPPLARVLLAEIAGETVGFALFYSSYSTLLAQPCLWLNDLFVPAPMRGMGVGTALLKYLAQIAESTNCGRIQWTVQVDNAQAIAFYEKQGARILENIRFCRLNGDGIALLAGK